MYTMNVHYNYLHMYICPCTEIFRNLFKVVQYSDTGSNARQKEEQAYMYFTDFLEDCELGMLIYKYCTSILPVAYIHNIHCTYS